MNEEFLRSLHANMGGDKVGSFEEFKNEFQSNVEFQKAIHANIGGDKVGSFDEFKAEIFGAGTNQPTKIKPSIRFSPKQEALLDAIADVESPDYNVIVGHTKDNPKLFSDYKDHPRIVGVTTKYGDSDAAGRYQFLSSTWDDINKTLKLPDFSPDSQRIAALYYAETRYRDLTGGRNIYQDIDDGKLENIQQVLGGTGRDTVWEGLQGDKEFANRFKSHLSRYEAIQKDNEKNLTPQEKLDEATTGLTKAGEELQNVTKSLTYNLETTDIPKNVDKKLPKSLEEIQAELNTERKKLDEVQRKYKQAHQTRQEELTTQFQQTPVFLQMKEKYDNQYIQGRDKYIKENIENTPEYTGLTQKLQDDLNRGLINQEDANSKLNGYLNEKIEAAPELKDLNTQISKAFSDEANSVYNGYASKDDILSDLNAQAESIFGKSKSFQKELLNRYNSQVDEYNKSAKAAQNKGSKTVGLPGGGPFAPGQRPQDYTGGFTKANMTSRDYQEELEKLPETTGFKKEADLLLWYKDQKRPVPTERAKNITKKANEYFAKGRELKLKQHEVLKEEMFTTAPVELGRAAIKDFNRKVNEYGDVQRGYYEQDKVAYKNYYDNLARFKETSDIKLSDKFGDRYTEFNKDIVAIDILKKSGKDVTDKIKKVQEDYKDILEDDDYILANQGVSDLYKAAKFEEDQLADKYQQKERLRNIEEEQAWANNNPVISTLLNTVTKTIGGAGQMLGAVLEQHKKFNISVPGFAILSGFAKAGAKELGEMGRVAGGDLMESSPFTTKMQGQFNETFATTPSGKRVVYDPDTGEPIYIRNEDGTIYEGFEADKIVDSAKGIKKETAINPFSGLGQALDIAAYMIPTIVASYASAGTASAIGLGATGVNVASKLGMFMGGFGQSYSDVKQEALKQRNIDLDEVEVLASLSGIGNGIIENFNPIEGKMFTKRIPKNIINENIVNMASGRVSKMDIFNSLAKGGLNLAKGGTKEAFLEEIPQTVSENAFKNYYNANKGTEFNTNVSTDQWKDIIIMPMGMGVLADGIRSFRGSNLGKESLKTIVNNRDMFDSFISGMEKTDPERAAKLRGDIEPLLTEIDAIDGLTPKRKEKSIELLYDIKVQEAKLASITEPTLRKPVEDKLVELRKELGKTAQVPTDAEGEPLEGEELTQREQAAAQRLKDKEKKQDNAIQEQKTTEVPLQPKTESSGTDTQGQSQPKPEGTTQQSKTEEQVKEEIKQPTLNKEAEDLLASIGSGSKPTFVTNNLKRIAKDNGVEVTDKMSADDVINALREKQSVQAPESTISTEQGSTTTQGEKVAPTQPESAQKANVLEGFVAKNVKGGNIPPKVYTKGEDGKWTAQGMNKDGSLGTPTKVGDAIAVQLDAESSRRAAEPGITSFKTAKGSTYVVNQDGTTTRDKAARKEHPGQQGPQPKSTKTYYVTEDDLKKLALVQATHPDDNSKFTIAELPDGKIAVGVVRKDGKNHIADKTTVDPKTSPAVGLYPVEIWDGFLQPHFGNKITEVVPKEKPAAAAKTPQPKEDKVPIQEETLEEAVQRVDSTSITQLDDIIARAEKDLETAKTKNKKDDIQKTINSLKKTRDQLSNSQPQAQTTKDESIESESKTSKGEEGKMDTPLDKEQGRKESGTEEEVITESLKTKDPTQKALESLVADPKTAGDLADSMSEDQAAAVLGYLAKFGGGVVGLKIKC